MSQQAGQPSPQGISSKSGVSAQHGWKGLSFFPILKAAQGVLRHLLSAAIIPSWIHAQHTKDVYRV